MITLSICLSLIILALLAAVFSQQSSDWVLPNDRDMYFPPFFKSEGFYRAFLINLSFAGISTAASAIQFVTYTSFWTLCDPFLAILMNLGLGLFASMSLKSETKEFTSGERKTWTIWVLVAGAVCFGFAVFTTARLYEVGSNPPTDQSIESTEGTIESNGQEKRQED